MRRFFITLLIMTTIIFTYDSHRNIGVCTHQKTVPETYASTGTNNILLKPEALTNNTPDALTANIALLQWTIPPGSVYYEIELLTAPPENPNNTSPSAYRFFSSREVFTNGYSADLSAYPSDHLYWRVRGLDYDGNPIGVFSDAAELYINHDWPQIIKPVSNTGYKKVNMPMPLYPVYAWIPVYGAVDYEVELTDAPPENPNGILPSQHRIRNEIVKGRFDCYDEDALVSPGTYYWRVRGLDKFGDPVGVYSDAEAFTVSLENGSYAATFGDSITHGGGAISYSPASVEYSFQSYLNFPAMNLGRSGDTTETMLNRFDADVLPYKPQYLIIMGGTNSLRGGVPADQVIEELTAIRDKCWQNSIRPIILTLPPINPDAIKRAFNEDTVPNWYEEFTAVNAFIREQRYCIDIEPFFQGENYNLPFVYAIDGLHLDIAGKILMAKIINENWSRVTQ